MTTVVEHARARSLPANDEAERAILGLVALSPEEYDAAAGMGLGAGEMSLDSHRRIYSAIAGMRETGRHVDLITICEELGRSKALEAVGGAPYISSLLDAVPQGANVKAYVKTVREKARLRAVIGACEMGIASACDGTPSRECMDTLSESILQIQTDSTDAPAERVLKFSDQVYGEWERIADSDADLIGLTTGLESLDLVTTGIREGELWLISGRTGDGKTALALQIAAANCRRDVPVGFFSIEMRRSDLLYRLWSHEGRIPFQSIRNPRAIPSEMRNRLKQAMLDVGFWPLFLVEDSTLSIQKLLAKARLLIRQEKVKLLICDYLQLLSAPSKDERERLTKVSNALRALAKDTGVPILAISQLNRPKDGNPNIRPTKFSLKESGSLENDAHVIVITYRPVDKCGQPTGEDELMIAKQRHGPVSNERVSFDPETLTFFERQVRR